MMLLKELLKTLAIVIFQKIYGELLLRRERS